MNYGYLSDLELLSYASLSDCNIIKKYVKTVDKDNRRCTGLQDPNIRADMRRIMPEMPFSILNAIITDEQCRQTELRRERRVRSNSIDGNKPEKRKKKTRLLTVANSFLLPAYMHSKYSLGYEDVKIINLMPIALLVNVKHEKKLVYRLEDYVKTHQVAKTCKTVDEAIRSVMHVDVKVAQDYGELDGRKVTNVWNNWLDKVFYITVEGLGNKKFEWRETNVRK